MNKPIPRKDWRTTCVVAIALFTAACGKNSQTENAATVVDTSSIGVAPVSANAARQAAPFNSSIDATAPADGATPASTPPAGGDAPGSAHQSASATQPMDPYAADKAAEQEAGDRTNNPN